MTSELKHLHLNIYDLYPDQKLGSGNFGTALAGINRETGSPVAAKISTLDSESFENVRKEQEILRELFNAPHAVQMRNYFETISPKEKRLKRFILILDLVRSAGNESKSVRTELERMKRVDAYSWREIVSYTKQIAEFLVELKRRGIVHGDLKTENTILNADSGLVTVLDFGSASEIQSSKNNNERTTVTHRAPEMFLCKKEKGFGPDMWGLGVSLFEIYTGGFFPFPHDDKDITFDYIITSLGPPPESFLEDCKRLPDYKKIDQKCKYDWREALRWAAKKRNDCPERVDLVIDFLNRIFQYENRLTPEEALVHPLLREDVHIKLDCEKAPQNMQKEYTLSVQDLQIPLSAKCIHLWKTENDEYEIKLLDSAKKCLQTFKPTLVPGSTFKYEP